MADNSNPLQNPLLDKGKDVTAMEPYWAQVSAIVEGYDAIKKGGKDYLPQFPDEEDKDYKFRLETSKFTNIYRDVLEGLATKPFEEEISLLNGKEGDVVPVDATAFAEDVDGSGNNLSSFAALTFFNGINNAIDWIFVDYPTTDPQVVISVADAKAQGLKPFWTHVLASNVLEIRTTMVGKIETLTYIRIFEPVSDATTADCVRVFEKLADGSVTWQLWQKNDKATTPQDQFISIGGGVLSIKVIPLVPFATGRRDGRTFKYFPAMRDAADLQIMLYRDESALQFIKTMAGYPMLAGNGVTPEKGADNKPKKLKIGPMVVLYGLPDGNGNHGEWKFIEPSANSMEFLQKSIAQTKQDLRELGRQPLTALSSQLTTVTTSIAAGKARSAVTAWALMLKNSLENALAITMQYMNVSWTPQVNVYTGFDNLTDDAADLDALNQARDRGDLSQETYLAEYKRRKVLSPEFDYEAEKKKILESLPIGLGETGLDAVPPAVPAKKNPSNAKVKPTSKKT